MSQESLQQYFNTIFTSYQKRFISFAHSYVGDKETAKDIVMDSFLYCWENKDKLSEIANLPAYILTIVKNKSLNHLKHKLLVQKVHSNIDNHQERITQLHISSLETTEPQNLIVKEAESIFQESLEKLPPMTRKVFLERQLNGKTYKDIAENLNISERSVEYHLSKSFDLLKKALKDFIPFMSLLFHP